MAQQRQQRGQPLSSSDAPTPTRKIVTRASSHSPRGDSVAARMRAVVLPGPPMTPVALDSLGKMGSLLAQVEMLMLTYSDEHPGQRISAAQALVAQASNMIVSLASDVAVEQAMIARYLQAAQVSQEGVSYV